MCRRSSRGAFRTTPCTPGRPGRHGVALAFLSLPSPPQYLLPLPSVAPIAAHSLTPDGIAMLIARSIADLRQALAPYRHPAFVPTMGNLHDGHIALMRLAKPLGDVTVASIFVNRLQFLPHEDFDSYPRTWEADCAQLQAVGCDLLFAPGEAALYPQPQTVKLHPDPALADRLEGQFRPGFFVGVGTVVLKLFACVLGKTGGTAVFGKKDYQQLMVIRQMVQQLALPIEIVAGGNRPAADGPGPGSRHGLFSLGGGGGCGGDGGEGFLGWGGAPGGGRPAAGVAATGPALARGPQPGPGAGATGPGRAARPRLAARLPDGVPARRSATRHRAGCARHAGGIGRRAARNDAADRQPGVLNGCPIDRYKCRCR